ncbi:caspase family protein [Mesorhizobium sp. WSM2561]|uniref:caspase family protein n=1 Tax=Mesorhizobium sp. WSM2561 TaxID=1040985 RepID=UPI0004B881F8|nr:caspase family protein [Mesorhizobium sp. WSM2561]
MTLVWGTAQHQPGDAARTHILIIGVGRYRHLLGGAQPTHGLPPLGQLTSPPISARALANWFIASKLSDASAPLGSVELLLSDATGQNFDGKQIDDATSQNIQKSFGDWKARCDGHDNNVAVFYFCGHGLEKTMMVLLPEDFGESENNRWFRAIDFDRTYQGMKRCRAGIQLYVLDACRQLSQSSINDVDFGGNTLITTILGQNRLRTAPRLFASAEGLPAFGDSNSESRLTAALIACLNGLGATEEPNRWVIDTLHLGPAVQKLIMDENRDLPEQQRQIVDPAGGDNANGTQHLHVLPAGFVPNVLVNLGCNPDLITQKVTFYAVPDQGQRKEALQAGRWKTKLPAGFYTFGCLFDLPAGQSDVPAPRAFVRPPVWDYPIDVPPPHPA